MSLVYFAPLVRTFAVKSFFHLPKEKNPPQLVLISGCTGTGKSTFGMSVALDQGILRCISTDSIRQVMRAYSSDAALHRSSYAGDGDPLVQWRECCVALEMSIEGLIRDAIRRGMSMVLEGVHLFPSNSLLELWRSNGGVGIGCLLIIRDAEAHRQLIVKRGEATGKGAEAQLKSFDRIRLIQAEMVRQAEKSGWLQVEQRLEPGPLEQIDKILHGS